jgi:DNA polymerase-3 subunit chi
LTHRVDFYILKKTRQDAYLYLARLVEKVYSLNKTVLILTDCAEEASYIDDLLWQYQDASFLPHDIVVSAQDVASPISISEGITIAADVLVNLTGSLPQKIADYPRVIELVYEAANLTELSRQKYRQYQNLKFQIQTFHIKENN